MDDVFQNDPLLAYLKLNTREPFEGGTLIQEGFFYAGLIGGPFGKGQQFDISEKQVEQAFQVVPKLYEVNITLAKEDIQVFNKGPRAAFKLVDDRMTNAYMTMGANIAISLYLNGAGNFSKFLNGFAEICNDG